MYEHIEHVTALNNEHREQHYKINVMNFQAKVYHTFNYKIMEHFTRESKKDKIIYYNKKIILPMTTSYVIQIIII